MTGMVYRWTLICTKCDDKKVVKTTSKTLRIKDAPEWLKKHAMCKGVKTSYERVKGIDDAFF